MLWRALPGRCHVTDAGLGFWRTAHGLSYCGVIGFTDSLVTLMDASSPSTENGANPASLYRAEHQRDVLNRLKRIEGQIRGLVDMIEGGRECEDVAQQMTATRRAMDKAFYRMMTCTVIEAVTASGDDHDQARSEIERRAKLLEKYG